MWGQLNVQMDNLAKTYWNETSSTIQPFYPQADAGWNLWIQERKLSSWNRQFLYDHAMSPEILKHWSTRRRIPPQLIQSIDWEAGQQAIKQLGLNKALWVPKWMAGFAAVGKVQQRNKLQDHTECPRCSEFETTAHVVLCPAPNAKRQWEASIATLSQWLNKANTLPDIQLAKKS
jgi:hypothetical protein